MVDTKSKVKAESKAKTRPHYDSKKNIAGKGVIKTRGGLMKVDKTIQFMDAFYQNGGNATAAAEDVFNTTTRASAAEMGRNYLERARKRGLVASFMENADITYGKLIEHAFEKMKASQNPAWWDRLMREAGYARHEVEKAQKRSQPAITVNVGQAQQAMMDQYIEGEVVEEDNA